MRKALLAGVALFTVAIVSTTAFEGGFNREVREDRKDDLISSRASRSSWLNLQSGTVASKQPTTQSAGPAQSVADFQPMLAKYCFGCHNTRNPLPAGLPLALDTANFKDPGADALTWERVVKKLGVGAMPPQGSPAPGHAELTRFRSALVSSLDRAAAKKNNPGRYVLHRLNRAEYANAVRDLLGVTVDIADLLPSDGGDFGFDNIATALPTSPLLLERYLTAGLRIAELAVGDASSEPGTFTYTISTVVTQTQHVEGLPLGTRGGMIVRHTFPADGEYVFSGRLLKTVAEGLVGVEGHETPHQFVVTLDGKQVFAAPIGGKDDHEKATENKPVPREEFDKRMASPRIKVTAGLHEVGFTFIERPTQEQNMWQPVLRSSQEAHNPSGLPRLRNGIIEGPYNANGVSINVSRQKLFVCTPKTAAQEAPCANTILSTVARRAFRRPVTKADLDAPLAIYRAERASGGDFDAGIRAGLARILTSPAFLFRSEHDPATLANGTPHQITEIDLASR